MRIHPALPLLLAALLLTPPGGPITAQTRTVRSSHFAITHPARVDVTAVAGALEAGYRRVVEFGLRLPGSIAVTVHATTTEFARRSGATRMHLAGVRGGRLHLQPVAVLERHIHPDRAMSHELTHIALGRGAATMPRWLAEGVAMLVAGEGHLEGRFGSLGELESALAGAGSYDATRRAYGTAGRMVEALDRQIGRRRLLAALRAIASGAATEEVFLRQAGIGIAGWAQARLAAAPAKPGPGRRH